jgi:predicted RNA-binding protein with PUA-like domain
MDHRRQKITYYLIKTDPSEYSLSDLKREKKTVWDGVTNPLAQQHLSKMKKGDWAFFYHTGRERQIVGIVEITAPPFHDPRHPDDKSVVVEIAHRFELKHPVPLIALRADSRFEKHPLLTNTNLPVMPMGKQDWDMILLMSQKPQSNPDENNHS